MKEENKTVLIVDDDDSVRQSLVDYFEDRLWKVFEASSGEEALQLIETQKPKGCVVDIRLGGISGDSFIRKANRTSPPTVFVIFTGSPEYEHPVNITALTCLSKTIFKKPSRNLSSMESELVRMIENRNKP